MKKFTFCNDLEGNTQTNAFKKLESQFGDGYVQRTSIGINNKLGTWAYSRTAPKADIAKIKAFFDEHTSTKSFLYQTSFDNEVSVVAADYSLVSLGGGVWRISTTFTQSFKP